LVSWCGIYKTFFVTRHHRKEIHGVLSRFNLVQSLSLRTAKKTTRTASLDFNQRQLISMAPTFSRSLIFATPFPSSSYEMWSRPSNKQPIFIEPVLAPSPMWDRIGLGSPIFEESSRSPDSMWDRPSTMIPSCPCCMIPTSPVIDREDIVWDRPSTSATGRSESHSPRRNSGTGLGLRIVKSIKDLRAKASRATL
jgi:hypothetical protein